MADSARSVLTFEAGGVQRTVRPSFEVLAALEEALSLAVPKEEMEAKGHGLALLIEEMARPAPRIHVVATCAATLLAHADPPLKEPESHQAIVDAGVMTWLVDSTQPNAWGLLPRFVYLANYGPQQLQKFLEEEQSGKREESEPGKKQTGSPSLSLGARLSRLLKFWG